MGPERGGCSFWASSGWTPGSIFISQSSWVLLVTSSLVDQSLVLPLLFLLVRHIQHPPQCQLGRLQSYLRIHTMTTQVIISTHILKDLITFNKHRQKELINCLLSLVGLNVQPTTHVI